MSDVIERGLIEEAKWITNHASKQVGASTETLALRLQLFKPRVKLEYQCPACWILKERRANLDPIPSGTKDDAFECDVCGADFVVQR